MTDTPPGSPPPTGFTQAELARLVTYKAAITAGFYNDGPTRAAVPIQPRAPGAEASDQVHDVARLDSPGSMAMPKYDCPLRT